MRVKSRRLTNVSPHSSVGSSHDSSVNRVPSLVFTATAFNLTLVHILKINDV